MLFCHEKTKFLINESIHAHITSSRCVLCYVMFLSCVIGSETQVHFLCKKMVAAISQNAEAREF